ncbi:hypothetical protein Tco_1052199 [Tanacetum coccineum]
MLRNLSPAAFLDGFNINSAQHTCMLSELRLRYEHEIMTREKFQKKFTDNCAVLQQRDAEIVALKTRLEKAELEAAVVVSLHGRVSELETGVASERGELNRHVIKLGSDCERLRKEAVGETRRDMDNDLYPHMFTAIAARRWILSYGVRLALTKCAQSTECQSALGKVEAYDLGVKDDFVSVVTDFKNVSFGLLDELESLKDSPLASIMSALVLKDAQGSVVIPTARAAAERRGLCPRPVGGTSSSAPLHGSSLGIADYPVSTFVLSSDVEPTTQPPITQAHDDLFDTSVLDGAGGA